MSQQFNSFNPIGFGETVFRQRYALNDKETWQEAAYRITEYVCSSEKTEIKNKIFEMIAKGNFFPGGRTIHGAGRKGWQGNLLNCYIFQPEDNKESIGKVLHQIYVTATCGGGTGYNVSKIRPKGSDVGPHKVAAPGIVSFAKMVDAIGAEVRAGGSRRAAILGAVSINHPDVLEWIRIKQQTDGLNKNNLGILSNHNISIYINDDFINACKNDKIWKFEFNGETWNTYLVRRNYDITNEFIVPALSKEHCLKICDNYYKNNANDSFEIVKIFTLKAKWLWNKIIHSNLKCAEPAILNESAIRDNYAVEFIEPWAGNNPCTEAVTGHLGNCTLGSLNLVKYINNNDINWALLSADISLAVRFLDNVLSINKFPVSEQQMVALNVRRIGLGVMGYGHALIDLKLKYGSQEALKLTAKLARFIKEQAFIASINLAIEKGPCTSLQNKENKEMYIKNKFISKLPKKIIKDIIKHGIRNAVLLSIAPTGSIGSVAGVSTSIEPIYAPAFKRRFRRGEHWEEEIVFDEKFLQMYNSKNKLDYVVGAYDVTPEQHIATIAEWQKHIDQSISKTINCPKNTQLDIFSTTLFKYISDIKGVSTYLEGSRKFEPLEAITIDEAIKLIEKNNTKDTGNFIQECSTGACEI